MTDEQGTLRSAAEILERRMVKLRQDNSDVDGRWRRETRSVRNSYYELKKLADGLRAIARQ